MLEKIKYEFNKDKITYSYYFIFLCSVICFGLNNYLDVIFVAFWSFLALKLNVKKMLYLFIFLSFFDDVFIVDILKGSANRVILLIILIKLLFLIIKKIKEIKILRKDVLIILFFLISVLVGFFYSGFNFESITIFLNITVFVMFSIMLRDENKKDIFFNLMKVILCAVIFSCLFGLLRWNFMNEITGEVSIIRFKGTYEPNFMCFYIDLAFLSALMLKEKLGKFVNYTIAVFLVACAGLTVSVTGILTLAMIFIIYLWINKTHFKSTFTYLFFIGFGAIIVFGGIQLGSRAVNNFTNMNNSSNNVIYEENGSEKNDKKEENNVIEDSSSDEQINENNPNNESETENNGIGERASELLSFIENKDLDKLTSGRLPLAREFISKSFDRPLIEVLIGNGPTTKMLFTNFFYKENYSHNSYLDLLYNFGIIGFLFSIFFIYKITSKNYFLGEINCLGEYNKALKFFRLVILIYAFALSLYTKRMVLLFFLL